MIKADDGYTITDVIVDGKSQGPKDSYEFKNIRENHTLEVKVAKLLTGDHIAYIKGYPDGGVHPTANITRAEVSAIFYRLLSDDARSVYTTNIHNFTDVHNSWASTEISTLTNAGILNGYSDGTFRPDNAITRAEVVKITNAVLMRTCDKDYVADNLSKLISYNDLTSAYWAYYDVLEASNAHDYKVVNDAEIWINLK